MKRVKGMENRHYVSYDTSTGNRLRQEELQRLAQKIINSCEIEEVHHQGYGTSIDCKDGEDFRHVENGSLCMSFKTKFGIKYYIHMSGCEVNEIIEDWVCE